MQTRSKVLIAAAVAAGLGAAAFAGTAVADRSKGQYWRGHHGDMMGMHEGRGRHGGGMWKRIRTFAERYDTDKDGKISQAEIDANRTEWHKKYDTDGNGTLSLKEFEALWLEARRRQMVREFQRFDEDGDAAVTLTEYLKPLALIVEVFDVNEDGVLSKDDVKAWRERRGDRAGMRRGLEMMPDATETDEDEPGEEESPQPQQ